MENAQDANKRKLSQTGLENISGGGTKKGRMTEDSNTMALAAAAMQPRHIQ